MREKCKDVCKLYIPNKNINNCSYFEATIKDDTTVCYQIQYHHKYHKYKNK